MNESGADVKKLESTAAVYNMLVVSGRRGYPNNSAHYYSTAISPPCLSRREWTKPTLMRDLPSGETQCGKRPYFFHTKTCVCIVD